MQSNNNNSDEKQLNDQNSLIEESKNNGEDDSLNESLKESLNESFKESLNESFKDSLNDSLNESLKDDPMLSDSPEKEDSDFDDFTESLSSVASDLEISNNETDEFASASLSNNNNTEDNNLPSSTTVPHCNQQIFIFIAQLLRFRFLKQVPGLVAMIPQLSYLFYYEKLITSQNVIEYKLSFPLLETVFDDELNKICDIFAEHIDPTKFKVLKNKFRMIYFIKLLALSDPKSDYPYPNYPYSDYWPKNLGGWNVIQNVSHFLLAKDRAEIIQVLLNVFSALAEGGFGTVNEKWNSIFWDLNG